ncbi:DNA-binding MarR family transcriptional regulator [Methylorubrum rhodinum]|uniref:DNA-binding MarR family transcriptional regulator n=1 Tax=Methylorubrum rhodinum TaxID=29428 RepID=A0A840ZLA0_9HYPH|nr:MarR family winged helix-turn-helix transcriptional regulator [Methylorubrum rhodinum]MBB5758080.1 DNA-binding MarR family transcriptional regulator [Methylorubrum rhodinum]
MSATANQAFAAAESGADHGASGKGASGKASEKTSKSDQKTVKRLRPPAAKSVGWALVQAARLHRARVGDRLAALDLFAGQEQVVQALAAAGSMTMGDLAATLRVRPPTASKTISRLAALGFVERRAEAGDGRIVRVRLTEAGLAKAAAIERIWDEVEAELLEGFDNKERRRLRKLLRRAARGLAEAAGVTGHEADHEMDADGEPDDEEADALLGPTAADGVATAP